MWPLMCSAMGINCADFCFLVSAKQEVLNARANKTMAWWEWEPPQLP